MAMGCRTGLKSVKNERDVFTRSKDGAIVTSDRLACVKLPITSRNICTVIPGRRGEKTEYMNPRVLEG